jgi:hypothetical protein
MMEHGKTCTVGFTKGTGNLDLHSILATRT